MALRKRKLKTSSDEQRFLLSGYFLRARISSLQIARSVPGRMTISVCLVILPSFSTRSNVTPYRALGHVLYFRFHTCPSIEIGRRQIGAGRAANALLPCGGFRCLLGLRR